MKNVHDNWNVWVPKIFQKAKLEAQQHKKTFQDFRHILMEFADKSEEDLCKGTASKKELLYNIIIISILW